MWHEDVFRCCTGYMVVETWEAGKSTLPEPKLLPGATSQDEVGSPLFTQFFLVASHRLCIDPAESPAAGTYI